MLKNSVLLFIQGWVSPKCWPMPRKISHQDVRHLRGWLTTAVVRIMLQKIKRIQDLAREKYEQNNFIKNLDNRGNLNTKKII